MTINQIQYSVAILGFGLSGSTFHAPIIKTLPGFNIARIFSREVITMAQKYPEYQFTDKLEDILTDPTIKLVINTLPNELHYSITKQCLLAGKNVVVEKPFVTNCIDGAELIQLASERNLLLSVYHNRRWDNSYLTLQQILPQLGEVYLYEAYFDRFRPVVQSDRWKEQEKPGSGLLYDLGSHLIDQALDLFGMPQSITADIISQRKNAKVTDYFHLTLNYDKKRVILGSSTMIANPRPILAVYGYNGSYIKTGLDPQEAQLRAGLAADNAQIYGIEDPLYNGILTTQTTGSLLNEKIISLPGNYGAYYRQIYSALSTNSTAIPVSAASGLAVIKIIELAQISSAQQKTIFLT